MSILLMKGGSILEMLLNYFGGRRPGWLYRSYAEGSLDHAPI